MKTKLTTKLLSTAVGLAVISNSLMIGNPAVAASAASSTRLPAAPAWGHFVDSYKNNTSVNDAVYSNPAIGILSGYLNLWKPGSSWDNGTKLNSEVLDYNIQYVADIAAARTPEEEQAAYYDDRRNQTYGAADGLGSLSEVYRSMSGTYTTITDIPDDATSVKYNDGNGQNKGGDSNSQLGSMVDLIGKLRGNYASTTPAKNYFSYPRPYRWTDPSIIVPVLLPARSSTPETDGGFPSGHTNASYLAALSLAYAVPERFQELLTRASEMGNNRIVAGMHSPLDVMGGRVMATALAAATLNDPENAALKQAAYGQAHDILLKQSGTAEDRFSDYEKNKAEFTKRLTYGFSPIGSTTEPMVVPKGAEVLLETRLPYLSDEQRREVLATTGLPSGYPLLDDPEGWGRLNLFAAADGYGAFDSDVTVAMDAGKGGFHALDQWRNDISGTGKLTKEGTGTLKLLGNNTYSGGTRINAGTLEGGSATAFGSGDVVNAGGSVVESVYGKMTINGNFAQSAGGILELNLTGAGDVLEIKGKVQTGGKLRVKFANNYVPGSGTITLVAHDAGQRSGEFGQVEIGGLPSKYTAQVVYQNDRIALSIKNKSNGGNSNSGGNNSSGGGGVSGSTDSPAKPEQPVPGMQKPDAKPGQPAAAEPATAVSPFKADAVSREAVLKAVGDAVAATKNENKTFSDTSHHWGENSIAKAVKLRIVDGYKDGTFRPDGSVTRAEFTAMIVSAFGLTPSAAAAVFKDTGSHWAAGYIGALAEKGIVNGYADGSFKPNATITRAEMVTMISRVMNLSVLSTGARASYSDVSSGHWAADAIEQASSAKLIQGISASSFAPDRKAARAEAVTLILRALESDSKIKAMIEGL
ncbi:S-layer homology domain-containing protein [Paenibacillus macerans]|uniref:S-layer homology domain-containing protein n=1 Tax=Paenibacillus macerans TaxID=44252 RepID=UPI000F580EF0|nr:S-layer homology domain-containing protein [Paenibacillus macerans]MBS5910140.1 S-layer homology domain-containing protein [Paenibacillus macerans]MEC0138801.1 S-layer homology domain-containing protein [Paenibacillus macerans]MEC0331752.1 S-layer homology domain-containing protein [Paenibacillus macerans]